MLLIQWIVLQELHNSQMVYLHYPHFEIDSIWKGEGYKSVKQENGLSDCLVIIPVAENHGMKLNQGCIQATTEMSMYVGMKINICFLPKA